MATHEQGMRGNGRGADHDREEMMRDPDTTSWRGRGRDIRGDLDRRTNRDDIDRRHDWHRGGERYAAERGTGERYGARGGMGERGGPGERWGTSEGMGGGDRFMRGEGGDRSGGRIESTHYVPDRGGGYGSQYGSEYSSGGSGDFGGGYGGGYGNFDRETSGYGGYETGETRGPRGASYGGGYGGYGSGEREGHRGRDQAMYGYGGYGGGDYSGGYEGIGPGREGTYTPAGSYGGPSGSGSLMGTYGGASGWESEQMGMRPSAFALHSMMMKGRDPREMQQQQQYGGRRAWEREGSLVRDVMTKNPRTVHPDATVREAAKLMREEDAGIMPVVQDGRVLGVVTDRDLAMRVLAEGKDIHNTRVSEVMSSDVHVCTPDDKLVEAVRMMGEENVRRLPVVDRDDHLKGMLSMTDVAREAEIDYALQEALEQIASRRSFWSRW